MKPTGCPELSRPHRRPAVRPHRQRDTRPSRNEPDRQEARSTSRATTTRSTRASPPRCSSGSLGFSTAHPQGPFVKDRKLCWGVKRFTSSQANPPHSSPRTRSSTECLGSGKRDQQRPPTGRPLGPRWGRTLDALLVTSAVWMVVWGPTDFAEEAQACLAEPTPPAAATPAPPAVPDRRRALTTIRPLSPPGAIRRSIGS